MHRQYGWSRSFISHFRTKFWCLLFDVTVCPHFVTILSIFIDQFFVEGLRPTLVGYAFCTRFFFKCYPINLRSHFFSPNNTAVT